MMRTNSTLQEKKEENELTLRLVWIWQLRDSKSIQKRAERNKSQQPITAATKTTRGQTEKRKLLNCENRNGKKNNFMDTSEDKQRKLRTK